MVSIASSSAKVILGWRSSRRWAGDRSLNRFFISESHLSLDRGLSTGVGDPVSIASSSAKVILVVRRKGKRTPGQIVSIASSSAKVILAFPGWSYDEVNFRLNRFF